MSLRRWAASAAWFGIGVAGYAASLSLIRAGNRVGYQHYLAPSELGGAPPVAIITLALETLAVVAFGAPHARALLRRIDLAPWRAVAALTGMTLVGAAPSQDPGRFGAELLLAASIALVHLGAALLCVRSLPAGVTSRLDAFIDRWSGDDRGVPRPVVLAAALVACVAAILAVMVYERHPHVPDEVVYLLQARYLAAGQFTLAIPPDTAAFNVDLMMARGDTWFSPVPPGWPYLLAIATAIGLTWFLNPLLAGCNVILAWMVLRNIQSRRTAMVGSLLLAISPWHLFMGMNIMTHTATLTAALAAAAAVGRLRRDPRLRWGVAGGVGIAIVGLIRPLEAVPLALLLGFWSLGARGRRLRLGPSIVLTATTAVASLPVLAYNKALTGSATTFPIMAYTDAAYGPGRNALGFGANRGLPFSGLDPRPGHDAVDVVINASFNLFQTNVELFGWASGSLLVLFVLLASGRMSRSDGWLLVAAAALPAIHSLYYFSGGPDFGARYWYLMIVPSVALAARGLEAFRTHGSTAVALVLTIGGLFVFVPWRATDKYHHYRGMQPHAAEVARDAGAAGDIVLVRGRRHPDFASAFVLNPLDLEAPGHTVFAWDRGPAVRSSLAHAYAGRRFWVMEGPTVTGGGYRMMAGPLDGAGLVARPDSIIPWP